MKILSIVFAVAFLAIGLVNAAPMTGPVFNVSVLGFGDEHGTPYWLVQPNGGGSSFEVDAYSGAVPSELAKLVNKNVNFYDYDTNGTAEHGDVMDDGDYGVYLPTYLQ